MNASSDCVVRPDSSPKSRSRLPSHSTVFGLECSSETCRCPRPSRPPSAAPGSRAAPPSSEAAPLRRADAPAGCCWRSAARPTAAAVPRRPSMATTTRSKRLGRESGARRPGRESWRTPCHGVVDVSSENGEKPQSSVVPSCSMRDVFAPLRGPGPAPPRRFRYAGRSARRRRRRPGGRASCTGG